MKILITGGAGFIGSHVADRYIRDGHAVVIVDNLSTGQRANLPAGAAFYEIDIRDPEVAAIVGRERPDIVNHHAAQIDLRRSVREPIFDARVNIEGTLNVLAAALANGVRKVIFASTGGAMYGNDAPCPARETDPLAPCSPYGIAKLAAEKYCQFYSATHGLPCVILRYANVYGPRQNPHGEAGVVAIFCDRMLAAQPPIVNGDGRQTRDYVFVADVVEANARALTHAGGGIFNIGTGIETDVVTVCRKLTAASGRGCAPTHGPAKPGEQQRSVVDISLAKKTLGWAPRTTLVDGLAQTWRWFAKSG